MVVKKQKKVRKYRGTRTHGGGSGKKRRGSGSRGGRGNAGTGKRAGQKKAGMPFSLGRHGFTRLRKSVLVRTINVGDLTSGFIERLVREGKATKEGTVVLVDLGKLGYTKLLGAGSISIKLKIHVSYSSAGAIEKVEAAGGQVVSSQTATTG